MAVVDRKSRTHFINFYCCACVRLCSHSVICIFIARRMQCSCSLANCELRKRNESSECTSDGRKITRKVDSHLPKKQKKNYNAFTSAIGRFTVTISLKGEFNRSVHSEISSFENLGFSCLPFLPNSLCRSTRKANRCAAWDNSLINMLRLNAIGRHVYVPHKMLHFKPICPRTNEANSFQFCYERPLFAVRSSLFTILSLPTSIQNTCANNNWKVQSRARQAPSQPASQPASDQPLRPKTIKLIEQMCTVISVLSWNEKEWSGGWPNPISGLALHSAMSGIRVGSEFCSTLSMTSMTANHTFIHRKIEI